MSTRDQFGKYLLLKKLTEDPLGETFRAGQVGAAGMDRVVLLRVFNGPGLRGDQLLQGINERKELLELLRSPNLAEGVDAGEVHGVPYVAWDYVSGKDLRTLMDQAEKQFSPIPTDQALLIAERIALGLGVAHGTRGPDGQRVHHGFLVPHLVLVSNEGDTRLMGFAAAPVLRRLALAAPTANHFRPFVSPEAQASPAVTKADDVYALGGILYELLTGQKLPPAPAEGYGTVVDRATLANEGTALPPQVADLLKRSLAPTGQRIDDVAAWHKDISKILFEGSYNPTTFNLAFFMHNLFRDEIEKESEEIEAERTMEVPVQAAPEPAVETAAPASVASPAEDTGVFRDQYGIEGEKTEKSRMGMIIGAIAAVIVVAAVGFFATRGGDDETASETASATQPAAAAPAAADAAAKELEEKMAQLDALIAKQQAMVDDAQTAQSETDSQDDARAKQFEQELAALKAQLQAAEKEKEAVAKAAEEARMQEEAPEPAESIAVTEEATEETAEETAEEMLAGSEQAEEPGAAEEVADAAATTPASAQPPASTEPQPPATAEAKPQPAVEQPAAKQEPATPPPTATSGVKSGDLVQPGPGVIAPILQRPPRPRFPAMAKRLNKRATVEVNVLVSEKGRVLDARLKNKKKAGYGFDEAAIQAAKDALYKPATKDGVPVKIWVELRIAFQ